MTSSKAVVSCNLIPVGGDHAKIELNSEESVVLGRCPLTAIADSKCSRKQVEVTAHLHKKEIVVKQHGKVPSNVNGRLLQQGKSVLLGETGWLELLLGKYRYNVDFTSVVQGEAGIEQGLQKQSGDSSDEEVYLKEPPVKKVRTELNQTTLKSKTKRAQVASVSDPKQNLWKEIGSLLVFQYGIQVHSAKLAAFDIDNTIIQTNSGKKFATGPTDWKFMNKVPEKLKSLNEEGFRIVFITNQLGISKGKPTKQEFKNKSEDIASKLDIPFLMLAATDRDLYRKPCIGMWNHLLHQENGSTEVDTKHSFYVGDAAGREANWVPGRKKDFSCADRKLAFNLGITFYTPEEMFFKHPPTKRFNWGEFNPTTLDYSRPSTSPVAIPGSGQELIVFVGCPASGKSKFFKTFMEPKGYWHISRDTLGSWQKCVAKCTEHLKHGKSVVIDNTNPDRESRSRYTNVGKNHKIPMRCFQFTTTIAHAKHNNRFRELTMGEDNRRDKVNDMVYNIYKSRFVEPSCDEGFIEIVKIDFVPAFKDASQEKLYKQFLN